MSRSSRSGRQIPRLRDEEHDNEINIYNKDEKLVLKEGADLKNKVVYDIQMHASRRALP